MKNVLFISDFILAKEQGAKRLSQAHEMTLCSIFGETNVDVIALNASDIPYSNRIVYVDKRITKIEKLLNVVMGMPFLLRRSAYKQIIKFCKQNRYDFIFIDHSIYGKVSKGIKKVSHSKIITFFHGIMQYQNEEYKKQNKTSIFYPVLQNNMKINESLAVQTSDKCILLNERDNINFMKYYRRYADAYFPVYYQGKEIKIVPHDYDENEFNILFVGGYFWPNIHGISWFVINVMPHLNKKIKLNIVGNGMEKLRSTLTRENVNVIGKVQNLDDWYNNADIVIGPIFEGEGMKSKTCEAIMYGKRYLGTEEALCGYPELREYQCDSEADFINSINAVYNAHLPKYSSKMREIYLKNYSPVKAENTLREIMGV